MIFSFGTAPRVAAVARRGVADLAEVAPERHARRAAGPGGASARRRSGSRRRCRRRSGRSRSGLFGAVSRVPLGERHHVLDARAHRVDVLDRRRSMQCAGEHVAERRVLPAGDEDRQVLLGRREQPASSSGRSGSARFSLPDSEDPVHELVREVAARPSRSAAIHSSSTARSMRRIASSSGMQVSVTRFMWRSSSAVSSAGVSSR